MGIYLPVYSKYSYVPSTEFGSQAGLSLGKLAAASPLLSDDVEKVDGTVGSGLLPVARGKWSPASSSRRGGSWSP